MRRLTPKYPIDNTDVGIDFSKQLATGETVLTVHEVKATVVWGTDPAPAAILDGPAEVTSPIVIQWTTGGLAGVDYKIRITVDTSATRRISEAVVLPIRER